jgi:hypothetical protein
MFITGPNFINQVHGRHGRIPVTMNQNCQAVFKDESIELYHFLSIVCFSIDSLPVLKPHILSAPNCKLNNHNSMTVFFIISMHGRKSCEINSFSMQRKRCALNNVFGAITETSKLLIPAFDGKIFILLSFLISINCQRGNHRKIKSIKNGKRPKNIRPD